MDRMTTEMLDPYAKEKHFTLKGCPDQCSSNCFGCKVLMQAIDRLAAYEDTGLEPEEIKEHEAAYIEIMTRTYGPLHQKIGQWLQAEQEGRLVVLPCGSGAELERDGYTFRADHWNHVLTAFRDAPEAKSGKQVALFNTKEAETALKGGDVG